MSDNNNHSSKDDISSNSASLNFEVTENMSKIGLEEFVFKGNILQFGFGSQNICIVPLPHNKATASKLFKDIRNRLSKRLEDSVNDSQTLEAAISDIENQIIEKRDEIFLISTNQEQEAKVDPDEQFKNEFQEEVSNLRNHFTEASNPYKEWQLKVVEKYERLKRTFERHYPEAWIFMEFCLSVKSILNIVDFTLPFMGVILAPPSSSKTMVIQLFRKYLYVFYTDGFTSRSLVSHNAALNEKQLQKVDMLPKMKNKLVLTPELALFFTGKEEDLQKVMGIITRVLDGHGLENDSGAHGHRKYGDTMFVWLGAAVEIPFRVWKLLGTLGHKIYFIRPNFKKKTISDLKQIAKNNNFSSINKEIELALLDYLKIFDAVPEIEGRIKIESDIVKIKWNEEEEGEQDKALEYIAQLANILAPLRGDVYVSQSKNSNRNINYCNDNDNSSHQEHDNQYQKSHQIESQDYDTDFPIIRSLA